LFYSGSDEPYVREYKEFAGVTIIIRTIVNPRAFASLDPNSKSNQQAMRRKSEFSQNQANTQDKVEHTEKADHAGICFFFLFLLSFNWLISTLNLYLYT
jgi:hypothetical protein